MPAGDTLYLVITLAATYPNGEIGYVTGIHTIKNPVRSPLDQPTGRNDDLDAVVNDMLALYRADVGEAYAMTDFTFTIHEASGRHGLFWLMGPEYLKRQGVSGTRKPGRIGITGLV